MDEYFIFKTIMYYHAHLAAIFWSHRRWKKIKSLSEKNINQGIKKATRNRYIGLFVFTISFIPHTIIVLMYARDSIIAMGFLASLKHNFHHYGLMVTGLIITIMLNLEFYTKRSSTANLPIDIDSIEGLNSENLCLYLRSFAEDSYNVVDRMPHMFTDPFVSITKSLDSRITTALREKYTIVKFDSGKEDELNSDMLNIKLIENWKEKLPELLRKSKLIIVKPGLSNGLKWEIMKIIEGNHLSKSVFLDTYGPDKIQNLEEQMKDDFITFLETDYGFELSPLPKPNFWNKIFPIEYNCFTIKGDFINYWKDIESAISSLD